MSWSIYDLHPYYGRENKICYGCGKVGREHCSRCSVASYCSRECQIKHWPTHKPSCKQTPDKLLSTCKKWRVSFYSPPYSEEFKANQYISEHTDAYWVEGKNVFMIIRYDYKDIKQTMKAMGEKYLYMFEPTDMGDGMHYEYLSIPDNHSILHVEKTIIALCRKDGPFMVEITINEPYIRLRMMTSTEGPFYTITAGIEGDKYFSFVTKDSDLMRKIVDASLEPDKIYNIQQCIRGGSTYKLNVSGKNVSTCFISKKQDQ